MNISIGGGSGKTDQGTGEDDGQEDEEINEDVEELENGPEQAAEFLKTNPAAKIIVVIDTHCLENGAFVYTGTKATEYLACYLSEVGATLPIACSLPLISKNRSSEIAFHPRSFDTSPTTRMPHFTITNPSLSTLHVGCPLPQPSHAMNWSKGERSNRF